MPAPSSSARTLIRRGTHLARARSHRWRLLLGASLLGTVATLAGCGGGTPAVLAPLKHVNSTAKTSQTTGPISAGTGRTTTTDKPTTTVRGTSTTGTPSTTSTPTTVRAINHFEWKCPCTFSGN